MTESAPLYVSIAKKYQDLTPAENTLIFAHGVIDNPYSIKESDELYTVPVDVRTARRPDVIEAKKALNDGFPIQPCDNAVTALETKSDKTQRARNYCMAGAIGAEMIGATILYTGHATAKKSVPTENMSNASTYGGGTFMAAGILLAFGTLKLQQAFNRCKQGIVGAKTAASDHTKEARKVIGNRLSYDSAYLIN